LERIVARLPEIAGTGIGPIAFGFAGPVTLGVTADSGAVVDSRVWWRVSMRG
jgi:hypothetical protein